MKQYYDEQYVPENMIIVIGGAVSENVVLEQIKSTFGSQKSLASPVRLSGKGQRLISSATVNITMPEISASRIIFRYPIPSFYHADVYPLDLLAYILGNGEQSMMYQEFVVRQKIATDISVISITPSYDYGYFEILIETEELYDTVVKSVQDYLNQIQWRGIPQNIIDRAKKQKVNEYLLSQTSLDNYLKQIGQSMVMGQNPLFFSYYSKNFDTVSNSELQAMIDVYLNDSKRQSYVYKNKYTGIVKKSEASLSTISTENIKSGIEIIYVNESNKDIVNIAVVFDGGIGEETIETNGIGYLSSKLLGKSTQYIQRRDFQSLFESRGASIGAEFNHNSLSYRLTTTAEDARHLIPYFIKGVSQFGIDDSLFEEVKSQVVKSIQKKKKIGFQMHLINLKLQSFLRRRYLHIH